MRHLPQPGARYRQAASLRSREALRTAPSVSETTSLVRASRRRSCAVLTIRPMVRTRPDPCPCYPSLAAARSRIRCRSSALGGGLTTSEPARARLFRFRAGASVALSGVCVGSFCCMVSPGYVIQEEQLRWS